MNIYKFFFLPKMVVLGKSAVRYDILLQIRPNLAESCNIDVSRCGINGNLVCFLEKKLCGHPRFTPFRD